MAESVTVANDGKKMEDKIDKDSPLRRLIKIFRTNTVTKYHLQGMPSQKPVGVAKLFFKNGYDFRSSVVPGYSAYDRFARYSDYAEMESYPIINKALTIVAEEVCQKDENGKILKVHSPDKELQEELDSLFTNVLHLNGKEIYRLTRNLLKYGDGFYLVDATQDLGVINLLYMPTNEVEREEGFDKDEPTAVRFRWTTRNNQEIPNAFVAHFRLEGNDLFFPYGQSFVESARRPWRQLVLLEDAVMVYRITRAPERRAFYLDVMGVPPEAIDEVVNKFNSTIKTQKVVNDKGQVDLRYGATLTMVDDYVIPVRGQDSGTRIETLPAGQNINDIEDIELIKKNLFASLGIPKAFLTFDEDVGSKSLLTQEDIRFARTVARIQESILNELVKIAIVHLYLKGYRGDSLMNFELKMSNPSIVAELQKNELWRARIDLVRTAGEGIFDTTFLYKNFLHLTDDAIDLIRKGQVLDKMFQSKLMQIEQASGMGMNQNMMGGAMGGMGGGLGGGMFGGGDLGGAGLGGMNAGGAMPNLTGMPESFNPMAVVTGQQSKPGKKDLTRRNANERIATERGLPDNELHDIENIDSFVDDAIDADGIRRIISSPMGTNEHRVNRLRNDIDNIQKEYSQIQKQINEMVSVQMPWLNGVSKSAGLCESITIPMLEKHLGNSSAILNEIHSFTKNNEIIQGWENNILIEEDDNKQNEDILND